MKINGGYLIWIIITAILVIVFKDDIITSVKAHPALFVTMGIISWVILEVFGIMSWAAAMDNTDAEGNLIEGRYVDTWFENKSKLTLKYFSVLAWSCMILYWITAFGKKYLSI